MEHSSETNKDHLVRQDLQEIRFKCWEARSKWMNIGIELKLEKGELDALNETYKNDVDKCFTEMLDMWLKKNPTLADLTAALKQPAVGFVQLAKTIHMRRDELKESDAALVLKDSEVENLSFSHITTEVCDKRTRYELKQRLQWETSVIIRKFKILRQDFFDTLETEHTARYTRYLEELLEKDFPEEPNDVTDICKLIKENSNFFHYDLVEDMIKLAGKEKDKKHLDRYLKEFCEYIQRRVFEYTTKQSDTELRIELDSYYDKYPANEIITFQYKVSTILKRKVIANSEEAANQDVNTMNNEGTTNENEKQLWKHVTYYSLATIVVIIAILSVAPSLFTPSITNTHLSPKDCFATGRGLQIATIGESTNATLHTVDRLGKGCNIDMETIVCELVSESTGNKLDVDCGVKKGSGSQYKISYQPTSRGRHQLHIKVEGEHIKGSPFTVTVIKNLGTPIKIIDEVKEPHGVAINQRGEILVAETKGHRISIFSPAGKKLQPSAPGQVQFNDPRGVAVDDNGNIIVTDDRNRIQKFSPEYKNLTGPESNGSNPLQFNKIYSIAISPTTKKIAVPDWSNHHIQILNPNLTFNSTIGSQGSGNGQFNHPYDVAFDRAGNMYVTDTYNNRIQVFDPEGEFLRLFGMGGKGDGESSLPSGISIDSYDRVYVIEHHNHCVSVFTHEGKFLTSFGSYGKRPGQFKFPSGITVDENGIIYVTDTDNNRIQMF